MSFRLLGEGASHYHCLSRIVDRRFVLGDAERREFLRLMRGLEGLTGIRVLTYCLMSNHFHLLLRVPGMDGKEAAEKITDGDLVSLVKALNGGTAAAELEEELLRCNRERRSDEKAALRHRFLRRWGRLDLFMKELKRRFSRWYNLRNGRHGALWEERYRSMLVEDGKALLTVAAYIDLNPVRAGIVTDPADYRHSGFGEASSEFQLHPGEAGAGSGTGSSPSRREDIEGQPGGESGRSMENSSTVVAAPRPSEGWAGARGRRDPRGAGLARPRHGSSSGRHFAVGTATFCDGLVLGTTEFVEVRLRGQPPPLQPGPNDRGPEAARLRRLGAAPRAPRPAEPSLRRSTRRLHIQGRRALSQWGPGTPEVRRGR